MIIKLSGSELEEALSAYLSQLFHNKVIVEVDDNQVVECIFQLGSIEESHIEEAEQPKKRTRRKKVEVLDENDEPVAETTIESEPEEQSTHYANLPKLNQEDQAKYTQVLAYLSDNFRNKNRLAIEEIRSTASEELVTVLEANTAYTDWFNQCKEEDSEKEIQAVVNSYEESPEVKLMREVNEEVDALEEQEALELEMNQVQEEKQEPVKTSKPLFSFNKPSQPVAKSGSLFPSNK